MLVDAADGSPTWLIVKLGRIGRRARGAGQFVVAGAGKAWAAFPRSWIRGAAEIDPARGLTPAEERQLAAHYGMPLDAGRAATLAERPPTSQLGPRRLRTGGSARRLGAGFRFAVAFAVALVRRCPRAAARDVSISSE